MRCLGLMAVLASATMLLAACGAPGYQLGDELVGASAETVRSDGTRARMVFSPGRAIHYESALQDQRFTADGLYQIDNRQFCFMVRDQASECMFYPHRMMVNRPESLEYQDGRQRVQFTLRSGQSAALPDAAAPTSAPRP